MGFATALVLVTVAAAAIVVLHALPRPRQFRMWVTIGSSAIATVAIVWQLFAFLLVPPLPLVTPADQPNDRRSS